MTLDSTTLLQSLSILFDIAAMAAVSGYLLVLLKRSGFPMRSSSQKY